MFDFVLRGIGSSTYAIIGYVISGFAAVTLFLPCARWWRFPGLGNYCCLYMWRLLRSTSGLQRGICLGSTCFPVDITLMNTEATNITQTKVGKPQCVLVCFLSPLLPFVYLWFIKTTIGIIFFLYYTSIMGPADASFKYKCQSVCCHMLMVSFLFFSFFLVPLFYRKIGEYLLWWLR